MNAQLLLDTHTAIALLSGDPAMIEHVPQEREVFLLSIALGELYFGVRKISAPHAW
jgi:predicted nucleic acid-binding protein